MGKGARHRQRRIDGHVQPHVVAERVVGIGVHIPIVDTLQDAGIMRTQP